MDQPSIDGINTWFVSKAARELGLKVAISGLGGDELFGGYPAFRDVPRWVRRFGPAARVPALGRGLRRLALSLGGARLGLNPKAFGLVEYGGAYPGAYLLRRGVFMPWELPDLLDPDIVAAGLRDLAPLAWTDRHLSPRPKSAFGRVAALEASIYMRNQLLRDCDWASMAHSLEVRVPLVDAALLARVGPLTVAGAGAGAKTWLAHAPGKPLPEAVVNRRKTGFGVPVGGWSRKKQGEAQGDARSATGYARGWARAVMAERRRPDAAPSYGAAGSF